MAYRAWQVTIDGEPHLVELYHGYWSGKRRVRFDGRTVFESRRFLDVGSLEGFRFRGHTLVIRITPHWAVFRYDLYLDGRSVTTGQEFYVEGARFYPMPDEVLPSAEECVLAQEERYWEQMRQLGGALMFTGFPAVFGVFGPDWVIPGVVMVMLGGSGYFDFLRRGAEEE